jgi:hypothetical protein
MCWLAVPRARRDEMHRGREANRVDIALHVLRQIYHKFCRALSASIMRRAVLKVSATDGKESNIVVLRDE